MRKLKKKCLINNGRNEYTVYSNMPGEIYTKRDQCILMSMVELKDCNYSVNFILVFDINCILKINLILKIFYNVMFYRVCLLS